MTQPAAFLTVTQAVERLAAAGVVVSDESIRHWARTGRIAVVVLPSGRFLFRPEDVDAWATPINLPERVR